MIGPIRLGYLRVFPAMLLLAWAPLLAQSAQNPLTSIATVRHLSAAEAAKALAVDVTGVATYSNPAESDLFIQEGNGWIYVLPDKKYAIGPGTRVVVKGTTGGELQHANRGHVDSGDGPGAASETGVPQLSGGGEAGQRLPLRDHAGHCASGVVPDHGGIEPVSAADGRQRQDGRRGGARLPGVFLPAGCWTRRCG